jgi:uncharacterized membrane protein YidH (DUF202 family)
VNTARGAELPEPPEHAELPEPGLAEERTVLAWNRSGLAVVVCVAVLARHIWPLHGADQELALCLIAAAIVVWAIVLIAFTSARRRLDAPQGESMYRLITAGTLLLAVVGFVAAFAPP